jgi:hypothetical protein
VSGRGDGRGEAGAPVAVGLGGPRTGVGLFSARSWGRPVEPAAGEPPEGLGLDVAVRDRGAADGGPGSVEVKAEAAAP